MSPKLKEVADALPTKGHDDQTASDAGGRLETAMRYVETRMRAFVRTRDACNGEHEEAEHARLLKAHEAATLAWVDAAVQWYRADEAVRKGLLS